MAKAGLLLLASMLLGPACPAGWADKQPQPRTTTLVSFEPLRNHGVPLVQVRLNDKVTGTFMIDTGASDCLMTEEMAQKLGLKTQPAYFHGFLPLQLGRDQNDFATVKRLQMGPLLMTDASFLVIKNDELFKFPEQRVDGIIGGTLLSRFALFVDFPRHILGLISPGSLSDLEVQKMGLGGAVTLPLVRERIQMGATVVSAGPGPEQVDRAARPMASLGLMQSPVRDLQINVYSTTLECRNGTRTGKDSVFVDTGAPDTSISEELAERLRLTPEDKRGAATMFNGSVFGNVGRVPSVRLGSLTVADPLIAYPGVKDSAIPPLLGEDILAYCVALFDFSREKLYLQPVLPPLAAGPPAGQGVSPAGLARLRQASETYSYAPVSLAVTGLEDASDVPAQIALLQSKCKGDGSDAGLFVEIGDAFAADKQDGPAQAAYAKAVVLRRALVKAKPGDAVLLAELAEALSDARQDQEAETLARQATALGAGNARTWIALGRVLHAKSLLVLTGQNTSPDISIDFLDYEALVARFQAVPPAPAQQEQARTLSQEARGCFDKAVALAPHERQSYAARADFLEDDGLGLAAILREMHGERVDLPLVMHPAQYFADKDKIASLDSSDPDVLRKAILSDIEAPIVQHEKGVDYRQAKLWKSLPARTRQAIQEKINRLEALSRSTDGSTAAQALEAMGEVQYTLLDDTALAEATLRHALTLAPGQPQACLSLARMLSGQRRYDDLAALLTDQVKRSDTALLHLLLARTMERQGHWAEAETQAQSALKAKPDSFAANMAVAMLLLRRTGTSPDALSEAQTCLTKAQAALGTHPNRVRSSEFNIAVSVLTGLSGDPATARQTALDVLSDDRTNTQARDVLAALLL